MTVFFGILGYLIRKFGFQGSPIVLALILGPMAEYNFRLTLTASRGDYSVFVTRPVCFTFLIVALLSILLPLWQSHRRKRKMAVEGKEH